MYTKTQLKITVSIKNLGDHVEENKNTGWCSKRITFFWLLKSENFEKLYKINVKNMQF